jgi:U3 small nucleolar RNA-associated protein 10
LAVEEEGATLAPLLLGALTTCFQCQDEALALTTTGGNNNDAHDGSSSFLTPARFEAIMPRLVALLAGLRRLLPSPQQEATYLSLADQHLVPCLAHLAAAVGKDVLWKPFHHAVLMRTREEDAAVRLVALRVMLATFRAVGEEYLAMLPESISYLSELMEDEDGRVVALCGEAVGYIEDLSGESLEGYLA